MDSTTIKNENGILKVHSRDGYKHSYDSECFFAVSAAGEVSSMFPYEGIHNDAMRTLDGGGIVRGTLLEDGELQVFPILAWESGSATTKESEGFITKEAARAVVEEVIDKYEVKSLFFEFFNTGEVYIGNVEEGVKKLNRVRYGIGEDRYKDGNEDQDRYSY